MYISARALGGDFKVSLHQSGVWRFAYTKEHWEGRASKSAEDRVIERWNRPPPIEGVTSAFMVIVPSGEIGLPRHPLTEKAKKYTKNVKWVPPAPEGFATYFIVMYTDPGGPEPSDQDRFVDRFKLPNGQTVTILIQEHAISKADKQQLEAGRQYLSELDVCCVVG